MKQRMKKDDFLASNVKNFKNAYYDCDIVFLSKKQIAEIIESRIEFKRLLGFFLGVIIALFIVVINNKQIKKIRFNGDFVVNNVIKKDIYDNSKEILGLYFLNRNLNDLNYEIRNKYVMYEWISIAKNGNIIFVTITNNTDKENIYQELENKPIIAKKDGIIKHFAVYQGQSMVYYNKSVKKGDILISNVLYNEETIAPKGYVLAETFEHKEIVISKTICSSGYTGKVKKTKELNIFGIKIKFGKNKYPNFNQEKKKIFGIKNFISYYDVANYEKSDIINVYDINEAKDLCISYIDSQFPKTVAEEKIIEIIFLNISLSQDNYHMEVLVKKLENIG